MKNIHHLFPSLMMMAGLFTASVSAQVYRLVELPMQTAIGINDSGAIIGASGGYGLLWEKDVSVGLGSLSPEGINNRKQVAGSLYVTPETSHAFLWEDNILTDLGTLGGLRSIATAINDSGEAAGYSFTTDSTQGYHAFFWKNGVLTDIGTLGGNNSIAEGINDSGQVVGTSHLDETTIHAFLWDGAAMSDLGTLGGTISTGIAVNNAAQVVGTSSLVGTSGGAAFLWSGGGMTNLGYLDDSVWSASSALGINDAGVVVGYSTAGPPHGNNPTAAAFRWKEGVMVNLNSLTDTTGGWELAYAWGINNRGDIICWGSKGGYLQAALLLSGDLVVTNPRSGDLWIGGETDTIRWISDFPPGEQVTLQYSLDDGQAWVTIATGYPSDSGHYPWKVPDGIHTHFAKIRIHATADSGKVGISDRFRLRTLEMVRLNPDSTYTKFQFGRDSWSFNNDSISMWPESWFSQFLYQGGFIFDPYLVRPFPSESPFDSARASDFPDWPLFVRAFGREYSYQVRLGVGDDYNQFATAKWKAIKGVWGGSCSGMSLSAILGFDDRDKLIDRYPSFPATEDLFSVGMTDSLRLVINELFQHWDGAQHLGYAATVENTAPRDLITDLREMFLDESNDHRYLYLSWIDNDGTPAAHAIVPYKLERDTLEEGWYTVRVYDVSYPGSIFEIIEIDSITNSAYAPRWTSGALHRAYLMDRASTYLVPPTPGARVSREFIPAASGNGGPTMEIRPERNSFVRIDRSAGGFIEYAKGSIVDSIPGGTSFIPPTASPSPPAVYTVPVDSYRIALRGFSGNHAGMSIIGYRSVYSYERFDADSGESDLLSFNKGLAIGNGDSDPKLIAMESVGDVGDGSMKYRFSDMTLEQGDSVTIAQMNGDELMLVNRGPAKLAHVYSKRAAYYKHPTPFYHPSLAIPGNTALLFKQGDEPFSTLRVLVDTGIDGTIDDTIFVDNQPTDIDNQKGDKLPSSFALYQNYPNPFNPTTTISYDLKAASHVTLSVFSILGQEVAVLLDEFQGPGSKSVEWRPEGHPSGMYFYRLRAGSYTATKMLIYLR